MDRLGWPYDGQQIAELAARLTLHRLGELGQVKRFVPRAKAGDHPTAAARLHGGPAVPPSYPFGQEGSGGLGDLVPEGSLANQAYICSEYVAACYGELCIEIACGSCPYVTPGDFVADAKVAVVGCRKNEI